MISLSRESLKRVEDYLIKSVKISGIRDIDQTLSEMATGSKLSVTTVSKALDELVNRGKVEIIRNRGNRYRIGYKYLGESAGIKETDNKDKEIKTLKSIIGQKDREIAKLKKEVELLKSQKKKSKRVKK